MNKDNIIGRAIVFYGRNGLVKTAHRICIALKRAVWQNHMVLFHAELIDIPDIVDDPPNSLEIERITQEKDIPELLRRRLFQAFNEAIMRRHITERFTKGAALWLVKAALGYCGFGWSIVASPIEPYFFPLSHREAHLFDFHVFPEYRGRGLNGVLVNHILVTLKHEGLQRAFIEARAWNRPQMKSLSKTYFQKLGEARKSTFFGRTVVSWRRITLQETE